LIQQSILLSSISSGTTQQAAQLADALTAAQKKAADINALLQKINTLIASQSQANNLDTQISDNILNLLKQADTLIAEQTKANTLIASQLQADTLAASQTQANTLAASQQQANIQSTIQQLNTLQSQIAGDLNRQSAIQQQNKSQDAREADNDQAALQADFAKQSTQHDSAQSDQQNSAKAANQALISDILNKDAINSAAQNNANASANQASDNLNADITASAQLNAAVNSSNINLDSIKSSLAKQNVKASLTAESNTAAALNSAQVVTNGQLRDALSADLTEQGIDASEALAAANKAVFGTTPSPVPAQNPPTLDALAATLGNQVTQQLTPTLGVQQATVKSQEAVAALQGLAQQIVAQVNTLKAKNDQTVSNQVDNNMRAFEAPSRDFNAIIQAYLDPGKQYPAMFFSQVSHGTAHSHYSKAQQTIDIPI